MPAKLIKQKDNTITVQFTIELTGQMLTDEQALQQSDKVNVAIEHYEKAIEIEDAYRDQFRRIYPERKEVVSRLGEEKYQFAKQRLKFLTGQ